jgi:protein O-GlcNAc transferase
MSDAVEASWCTDGPHAAHQREAGDRLLHASEHEQAAVAYERALQMDPQSVRAHNNLGLALLALERFAEAITRFRRAIELDPDCAPAHHNLGRALSEQGQLEDALASFRRAAALQPALAESHQNCGRLLLKLRQPELALQSYTQVVELRPGSTRALCDRAGVLTELRHYSEALRVYEAVLQLDPQDLEALSNAAFIHLKLRCAREALGYCDRVLERNPENASAHNNRAAVLNLLLRHREALDSCDKALQLWPDLPSALHNRAIALWGLGDDRGAREVLLRVIQLNPRSRIARVQLAMSVIPVIPQTPDEIERGRAEFAEELTKLETWVAAEDVRDVSVVGPGQPFYLTYHEVGNRALLQRFGRLCAGVMQGWQEVNGLGMLPSMDRSDARLRVGIVSAHVRAHSVFHALTRGWIDALDRSSCELGLFSLDSRDAQSAWVQPRCDRFEDSPGTLEDWVRRIRAYQPDVLLYPEVGMDALTLQLAGMRLAPRQVASWGHPETTGLPTIDEYLSADAFEPFDAQDNYSERLVCLPRLGSYYEPYDCEPLALDLPALGIDPQRPVLLCPGTPYKYQPQHDWVLVEIARRLRKSQLVMFELPGNTLCQRVFARLAAAFTAAGMDAAKHLIMIRWLSRAEFFALMRAASGMLDTLGFSGFNTVMQAVECHLPLVAYEGRFLRGRFGSGIMRQLGLGELIAHSPDRYVDIAVRLVADDGYRNEVRQRIRADKQQLFRDPAVSQGFRSYLGALAGRGTARLN